MVDDPDNDGLSQSFLSHDFQVQLREATRRRPSMFIGGVAWEGLRCMALELIDRSHAEAIKGTCDNIKLEIAKNGWVTLTDNGPGIPIDVHHALGKSILELLFTWFWLGKTGELDPPNGATRSMYGGGLAVVNILSANLEVEVRHRDGVYQQKYARGKPTTKVRRIGSADHQPGTKVRFLADPEIFRDTKFEYDFLTNRMRELAFLTPGLRTEVRDERTGVHAAFCFDHGLADFVVVLNKDKKTLHPPICFCDSRGAVSVEVALQYASDNDERIRAYTDAAHNPDGGSHLTGFRSGLTRAMRSFRTKNNCFQEALVPTGREFSAGLAAVIRVRVPEPQFESNNKLRLNSFEVEGVVASIVRKQLAAHLNANPQAASRIMKKVAQTVQRRLRCG